MTLDNPALAGRTRLRSRRSIYERRAVVAVRPRMLRDVLPAQKPKKTTSSQVAKPMPTRTLPHSPAQRISRSQVLRRETVRTAAPKFVRRRRSRRVRLAVLPALAVVLFIFGGMVGVGGLRQNQKVAAQVKQISKQVDTGTAANGDMPSETKPDSPKTYQVAPSLPRTLTIPKIGVSARIVSMGVTPDNTIKAPNNIFDAGWFDGSAKPGDQGAMLIDGHVHGPSQPGVFVGLKKLKPKDTITVERGDGQVFHYTVVSSKSYPADKVDMGAALSPITPGKRGLNLITCNGALDASGTHYTERLVVFAEAD